MTPQMTAKRLPHAELDGSDRPASSPALARRCARQIASATGDGVLGEGVRELRADELLAAGEHQDGRSLSAAARYDRGETDGAQRGDRLADRRRRTMVLGEIEPSRRVLVVAISGEMLRASTAESEDRLIRVAGQHGRDRLPRAHGQPFGRPSRPGR
jgi:hypothetical protein